MSFRVSALASVAAVLGLSALSPAGAQPQVPVRPRYSAFQSVFAPGSQPLLNPGGGFLGQQNGFGFPGAFGGGFGGGVGPQVPGFVNPGTLNFPQNQPTAFVGPQVQATGVVGRFNYLGHWYGVGNISGGLGHWYPNGFANGRGVLGVGSAYGAGGLYSAGGGFTSGGFGGAGSVLGTAAAGGGAFNQPRR